MRKLLFFDKKLQTYHLCGFVEDYTLTYKITQEILDEWINDDECGLKKYVILSAVRERLKEIRFECTDSGKVVYTTIQEWVNHGHEVGGIIFIHPQFTDVSRLESKKSAV
jgi:hypothetical protein